MLLQKPDVGERHDHIDSEHEGKVRVDRHCQQQADGNQHAAHHPCQAHGDEAGGDRAEALDRMDPIGRLVGGVVEEVSPGGCEREQDKCRGGAGDDLPVSEHSRGAGSREDEDVLQPLPRSGSPEQRIQGSGRFCAYRPRVGPPGRADDPGCPGPGQQFGR